MVLVAANGCGGDTFAPQIDFGDGGSGDGCNRAGNIAETTCLVDDAVSIFVSPKGQDANPGTKAAPVKSILEGIEKAKAGQRSRVLVCAGTYAENVVLDPNADGIAISGGLDCTGWVYGTSNLVKVRPASGYALALNNLTKGTMIEEMSIESMDGKTSALGGSSIAVFANSSKASFVRVHVKSDIGLSGSDARGIVDFTERAPDGANGTPTSGGAATENPTCRTSVGGSGGTPTSGGANGSNGSPSITPVDPQLTGAGGKINQGGCGGGAGKNGGNGAGGSGGAGARNWGTLSNRGWIAAQGESGETGGVGQGGGGGAALTTPGGGGGGGAGGCGGAGGESGMGAGSSIGILSFRATLTLSQTTIQTLAGGDGGKGGKGQKGQPGSVQFGNPDGMGCPGGLGGHGGAGGGGGGGAGGLSVGILYFGDAPIVDGIAVAEALKHASIAVAALTAPGGMAGDGGYASGPVGEGKEGSPGTNGQPGASKAVIEIR